MTKKGEEVFTLIQFCRESGRGTHAPRVLAIAPSRSRTFQSENISARRRKSGPDLPLPARARALPGEETAFTLIELLVVIAIIAVLLGLVFPVFQGVLERAKKVQAKNDLTQIVTAVNAFYTEYGRYPNPTADSTDTAATYGAGSSSSKTVLDELRAKNTSRTALNSRQIVFISPGEDAIANPKGKIGSDGQFHDPWTSAYAIRIDADYDNQVANPYGSNGAGADPIRQGVITWSIGKDTKPGNNGDSKFTGSDDVISWQ
jgi:prepilin-type N-terminal cleavage/methylation domain-containing protein